MTTLINHRCRRRHHHHHHHDSWPLNTLLSTLKLFLKNSLYVGIL